jgi:hypothetical protein
MCGVRGGSVAGSRAGRVLRMRPRVKATLMDPVRRLTRAESGVGHPKTVGDGPTSDTRRY